jgi:hypothetical protein
MIKRILRYGELTKPKQQRYRDSVVKFKNQADLVLSKFTIQSLQTKRHERDIKRDRGNGYLNFLPIFMYSSRFILCNIFIYMN